MQRRGSFDALKVGVVDGVLMIRFFRTHVLLRSLWTLSRSIQAMYVVTSVAFHCTWEQGFMNLDCLWGGLSWYRELYLFGVCNVEVGLILFWEILSMNSYAIRCKFIVSSLRKYPIVVNYLCTYYTLYKLLTSEPIQVVINQ